MYKNLAVRQEKQVRAAEGYLLLDMPRQALEALAQIEDPQRDPFPILLMRGLVHRHTDEHAKALDYFEQAYQLQPDDLSLLLAMAWCCKRNDQLKRSIALMEQAYKAHRDEAIVLYNLACYWSLARNKTQALAWLGRALRMDKSLRKLIADEHDFDSLRHDPDFARIAGTPDDAVA